MLQGKSRDDTLFVCSRPCPMPSQCRIVHGKCQTCGKLVGPNTDTRVLMDLAAMMDGGMAIAANELSAAQWIALRHFRSSPLGGISG